MFEYRVVPFIGQIKAGDKRGAHTVATQLEALINGNAAQGWEFFSVDRVQIAVAPGCLAAFVGTKTSYIGFDQVIFRRQRA